jgi:putative membrane protein
MTGDRKMRWFYLTIIVVFTAFIVAFAFQNLQVVTVSFLGFSVSARLVILVLISYMLGAVSAGSLLAMLRRSYEGARRKPIA